MYISEIEPARNVAIPVAGTVTRLVAPNPSIMTYHGTNTYIVQSKSGLVIIDPGPDEPSHIARLISACSAPVSYILLTHHHADHSGAVEAIRRQTNARLAAAKNSGYRGGKIDIHLSDEDRLADITAIETPGHTEDHLCYQFGRIIFTGDHVMGWASTAILTPEGNASRYLASLRHLATFNARHFFPGHGPKVGNTKRYISYLIENMEEKERKLLSTLAHRPSELDQIISDAHGELSNDMRHVARRTIEAQLLKLEGAGKIIREERIWRVLQ